MNKILQDTYDVLEQRGWCQGESELADGRVCLEGAFCYAAGSDADELIPLHLSEVKEAWKKLNEAVREEAGQSISVWFWNDKPERTVEDVKMVLKKAIHDD